MYIYIGRTFDRRQFKEITLDIYVTCILIIIILPPWTHFHILHRILPQIFVIYLLNEGKRADFTSLTCAQVRREYVDICVSQRLMSAT